MISLGDPPILVIKNPSTYNSLVNEKHWNEKSWPSRGILCGGESKRNSNKMSSIQNFTGGPLRATLRWRPPTIAWRGNSPIRYTNLESIHTCKHEMGEEISYFGIYRTGKPTEKIILSYVLYTVLHTRWQFDVPPCFPNRSAPIFCFSGTKEAEHFRLLERANFGRRWSARAALSVQYRPYIRVKIKRDED